jgi:hypothetical protein
MSKQNQAEKQAQQDVLDEQDLDSVSGGVRKPFTNIDPIIPIVGQPVLIVEPCYPMPIDATLNIEP